MSSRDSSDDQLRKGRDEVIRLQGRIRSIISQLKEIEAKHPLRDSKSH